MKTLTIFIAAAVMASIVNAVLDALSARLSQTWHKCAWCGQWLRHGVPGNPIMVPFPRHVSHGICRECMEKEMQE